MDDYDNQKGAKPEECSSRVERLGTLRRSDDRNLWSGLIEM
jgi:hypothetical protein